jgi:hypothetical protein
MAAKSLAATELTPLSRKRERLREGEAVGSLERAVPSWRIPDKRRGQV